MHRRPGLAKVEIILAVLIVAVIAGLLLPAIMRVREAADRVKCANNLKQIALACENYNSANQGKLPPLTDQGSNAPEGKGIRSLFFNIWPYVEAGWEYSLYGKLG